MRARKFVSPGGIIVLLVSFVFMYATGIAGKPPRKFIYGIWGDAFDSSFTPHPLMAAFVPADQGSKFTVRMNILQDTLGFNMALNRVYNHVTAESLINRGFNVIESDSSYSPGKPSDYAWSWYLTWQSDANSIPPWYIGNYASYRGRRTFDSVGGRWDTVWVIGNQSGDTPGWVVKTGDSHFILKDLNTFGAPQRRASFKLKATGATGSNPVARIAAVRRDGPNIIDTLASRVILRNEFAGGYQDFDISWPQNKVSPLAGQFWEQYLLYWYGNDTLYFDEALSTDVIGSNVMAGVYDSNINGYTTTCTYGTNGSYLLGWWLLDGRTAPETAAPWGYIDSRLRLGAGQKGGFQNFEDEEYAIDIRINNVLTSGREVMYETAWKPGTVGEAAVARPVAVAARLVPG